MELLCGFRKEFPVVAGKHERIYNEGEKWLSKRNLCISGRETKRMKLYYRITGGTAEIVRCFGTDSKIEIPEQVGGLPVRRIAPYAFSARKEKEETDVLVFETAGTGLFRQEEGLLAGDNVESVVFPDGLEEIGRYIFYGCRHLKELSFSDSLVNIGSGAFTGCRELERLCVRLKRGEKSCVSEILGDLWQRIDVTFQKEESTAKLVFPEHYEEAVENTPARLLFTQHHGSGNNYRQCFYGKEMDYRKYDELFYLAKSQDKISVIADMVFSRLLYPVELMEEARKCYEEYIRENGARVAEHLIRCGELRALREMSERNLWSEGALDAAIEYAAVKGQREVLSVIMDEKHKMFPGKKEKYEL